MKTRRPRILINMAMSLDGKVTSAAREPVTFTSREDRQRLLALRARADAIVIGAGTAAIDRDQTLGIPNARLRAARRRRGQPEYPLRVVVSGRLRLPITLRLFRTPISPVLLVCASRAPLRRQRNFARLGHVQVCGRKEVDLRRLVDHLASQYGVRTILCEGGPTLNDAFFRAGLVDELFITLIPRIVGGRDAPTLVDGVGFPRLKDAPRGRLVSCRKGTREWFLHYRFAPPVPERPLG